MPKLLTLVLAGLLLGACTADSGQPSTSVAEVPSTTAHLHETTTTSRAGTEPGERNKVVISGDQSFPEGFTIPADESWVFDPDVSTTVTVSANVLVLGELVMKPASGDVEHALIFQGVDNSAFVGGGMDPVPSDVGLWVMGDGRLDLEGEEKPAWGYEFDPSWAGDEVMAAPNTAGDYYVFQEVTSTPPPNELGYPTELMNLTRNVRIEGTPEGFTHVFLRSTEPQTIRYVALRYMAPTFGESDATGRYGLHFHMAGEGSRGSIVEGVVIRDAGNHAFVPHASHGITFRDTIAYNVLNEAYWWDPAPEEDDPVNDTNDLIWDRAVVAGVDLGVEGNKFRLAGFFLGDGTNVTISNSVAVGVRGEPESESSGFIWPEGAGAVWLFQNNVAHNNLSNGVFVWQNNSEVHPVDGFTGYYNGKAGIEHGAYENSYQYHDLTLVDNGVAIISHALGGASDQGDVDTQIWTNITSHGATLVIDKHATQPEVPVRFMDCDFGRVVVDDADGGAPGKYDFVNCDLQPDEFDLESAYASSLFRVQNVDGTTFALRGDGALSEIAPFYG